MSLSRGESMGNVLNRIGTGVGDFWKSLIYSVDHMTPTNWAILGTVSVIIGFMLLRTQRF
ncbi:MAG: hypothetical protein MUC83_18740 [Pirellula sp.]|nr:hypothetical protein [Pirellula sp.]